MSRSTSRGPELIYYYRAEKDRWLPGDRYPRRLIRRLVRGRKTSGHTRLALTLRQGMKRAGIRHRFNDYRALGRDPHQRVGLLGGVEILERWRGPNPVVAGPLLFLHPNAAPDFMERYRCERFLCASEWTANVFRPMYGEERVAIWPTGIDMALWPDYAAEEKRIDFLIYEKVLWDRQKVAPQMLDRITAELEKRGLGYQVLHCGTYNEKQYKALILLVEHESQGFAYQEAMSCNVPILAWNPGQWRDPEGLRLAGREVPASSVPYFSEACGVTFPDLEAFPEALERFLAPTRSYAPRRYIAEHLRLEDTVQRYVELLRGG